MQVLTAGTSRLCNRAGTICRFHFPTDAAGHSVCVDKASYLLESPMTEIVFLGRHSEQQITIDPLRGCFPMETNGGPTVRSKIAVGELDLGCWRYLGHVQLEVPVMRVGPTWRHRLKASTQ